MKSDIFVLIPCHVENSYLHLNKLSINSRNKFAEDYLEKLNNISKSELVDRVSNAFERFFIGEYDLLVLADELSDNIDNKKVIDKVKINLFVTACERTRLSVLVGIICGYEGNPTNLLDQITREDLVLQFSQRIKLSDFIKSEFQIIKKRSKLKLV